MGLCFFSERHFWLFCTHTLLVWIQCMYCFINETLGQGCGCVPASKCIQKQAYVHLCIHVSQRIFACVCVCACACLQQAQFDSIIAGAAEFGGSCVIAFFHWQCCSWMQHAAPSGASRVLPPVVANAVDNLEQVKDNQLPVRIKAGIVMKQLS